MPPLPDQHALAVLALTVIALFLFTREKIPLETSSLIVLVLLTVGFQVFPYSDGVKPLHSIEFFTGFGHEALVAVCALMVVGHGLVRTGALEPVGRTLALMWSHSPQLTLLLTLVVAGLLSAFLNNTPVVVLLLPILISVSIRSGARASSILMPMGLSTLVGGMATTIGTSTNLLVVSVAAELGVRRLEMFDFFVPAIIAGSIGVLYLWLIAPRILPEREAMLADTSPRVFSASLKIPEGSYADGRPLNELFKKTGNRMNIKRILRGGSVLTSLPDVIIHAEDQLYLVDTPAHLKEFEQVLEARLFSDEDEVDEDHPLKNSDQQIAEIILVQGSPLINRTLNRFRFADRYQLLTLALHKAGAKKQALVENIGDIRLQVGDILLVQGAREQLANIKREGDLLVLDATADLATTSKAPMAVIIMALIILSAAFGLLPIAISAVAGVLLMLLIGILAWRDVGNALSAGVIMIVVVSLALGLALTRTGATEYLADLYLALTDGLSPGIILSGLILLMAVLTNIVSNNAAAVIGTPVAISIASALDLPAEAFVLAVLFGANMSYATPMAYKTNMLVMNAGNYTFADFLRAGLPLTIIMWLTLSWLLPRMYGF
ncbi:MAG: SLC13 family permease [Gammaproteobacteria bacterium]|jgi:di/tricarboxylate transporter|nr:SLC13 family permease [Gammaproteobacteria bacterium]